jgi:hypothetical protein
MAQQRIRDADAAASLQTSLFGAGCADSGGANLRKFRDNFGERDFFVKTGDYLADQEGFELAVRSEK